MATGGFSESRGANRMELTRRAVLRGLPLFVCRGPLHAQEELPDLSSVPPDLEVPAVATGEPAAGKRVRQALPGYTGADVHHLLYLPRDWRPGRRYPVIVEYAGNGNYKNAYGDVSTGEVEGSKLGFGISAGQGFIWISMPYVDARAGRNQTLWWGDVDATVTYCCDAVRDVCERFGGDPAAVILAGFSRGAIACHYIGLHDDRIADIWLAFIPYSHYDGAITTWPYAGADRASALERLKRLHGRAVFVCQERSIENTKVYLESAGVQAAFTFERIGFRNHNDGWTLRDIPERRTLRRWLRDVLHRRPGTYALTGRVTDSHGRGVADVRLRSGYTHWTLSNRSGSYVLPGLIASQRSVVPKKAGLHFTPASRTIQIAGASVKGMDFRVS